MEVTLACSSYNEIGRRSKQRRAWTVRREGRIEGLDWTAWATGLTTSLALM